MAYAFTNRSVDGGDNLFDLDDEAAAVHIVRKRAELKRDVLFQCKAIKVHIQKHGDMDELNRMRKELAKAFDAVLRLHYDFVDASHLTGSEEDEFYDFVREIRTIVKEAHQLIDDYIDSVKTKDSGMSSNTGPRPTEASETEGTSSRLIEKIRELEKQLRNDTQQWNNFMDLRSLDDSQEFLNEQRGVDRKFSTPIRPTLSPNLQPSVTFKLGTKDKSLMSEDWIVREKNRKLLHNRELDGVNNYGMLYKMLPKVELQPFTGNPKDWPEFIQMFKEMVHDVMPSNSQRMTVLRHLLSPEVKTYISDFLRDSGSYIDALDQLQRRYGQPQLVARAHLKTLINIPKIRDEDVKGLTKLSQALFGAIHALSGNGYEQDIESGMTLEIVVQKLPQRLLSKWGVKVYEMAPQRATLKDLAVWLDKYAVGETMFRDDHKGEFKYGNSRRQDENKPSILATQVDDTVQLNSQQTAVLQTSIQEKKSEAPSLTTKCYGCGQVGHSIYKCATFRSLNTQQRLEVVKKKGLCFRCLKADHVSSNCLSKRTCGLSGCKRKHHDLLHDELVGEPAVNAKDGPSINTAVVKKLQNNLKKKARKRTTLLRIVPVKVRANNKEITTYAVLDSGAEGTLIEESVARALDLGGPLEQIVFGTFHGHDPSIQTQIVNFEVISLDGYHKESIEGAYTVPNLNISKRNFNVDQLKEAWPHLRDVDEILLNDNRVSLLIGSDVQEAHVPIAIRRPPKHKKGPYGILTPFGWCCVGSITSNDSNGKMVFSVSLQDDSSSSKLDSLISQFWEIESFGTRPDVSPPMSEKDQRAMKIVRDTTVYNGERYVVGLPWNTNDLILPNNRPVALQRFLMLERRFAKDPSFGRRYSEVINEYLSLNHARKLKVPELEKFSPKTWYLPHHGVVNPNKPEKVRVVFDAAAKFKGVSLNDALLTGPNIVTNSLTVLMRFRQRAVPVSADIRKMFHQVLVRECDRSALRFLWREPGTSGPIETYEMLVQIFGAASSPFICTHTLRQVAKDFSSEYSDVAEKVSSNFYVDNLLDSFDTEEEAIIFCQRIFQLLNKGGFYLTQWLSSSRKVLASLPREDLSKPNLNLDLEELPTERTLGVLWESEIDAFHFKFKIASAETKRQVASVIATIYDPFGMLAPIIVVPKGIQQELWLEKLDWDDKIPEKILKRWRKWIEELPYVERLSVPRAHLRTKLPLKIELHAFSDASEMGYGAVIYLRALYGEVKASVSFVLAKSRVAPVKRLTIPKLELMGAVTSIRLILESKRSFQFKIDEVFYWTDSQTVIDWINSKHCKFEVFVANRIAEIFEYSDRKEWRHIPGKLNPADDISRGLLPSELSNEHRWLKGPTFLEEGEEQWPSSHLSPVEKPVDDTWIGHVKIKPEVNQIEGLESLLERSSNFSRVRRAIAYILRFRNIKRSPRGPLTAEEIRQAHMSCIRYAQKVTYAYEFHILERNGTIPTSSHIIKLTPFIDQNGLLRVGGRIDNGSYSYDAKHPIILPPRHRITDLLILLEHRLQRHCSNERLLAHLRQSYWIVRGRTTVKSVVFKECVLCKRKRAKLIYPLMAPLPRHRIEPNVPPFTNVGIDFFGPYQVTAMRRSLKRYGLLITCLVTRAVHIEITHSLDTDSFLMAFMRFTHRRGFPLVVYSDYGTQLTCGEKELRKILLSLKQEQIVNTLSERGIEWHFSPPAAPHFGGVWESLVKSAKRAFSAIVNNNSFNDELLMTFMTEVEFLLNNRPLVHISVDPRDPEPLTPNHFLLGRSVPSMPPLLKIPKEVDAQKGWLQAQTMTKQFWQRWLKEYLPSLTDRRKWLQPDVNLTPGDIVLIADPASPKGKWPIGRVTQVVQGRNGIVRRAFVKTTSGEYERPVAKLCLMETSNDRFAQDAKPGPAVSDPSRKSN